MSAVDEAREALHIAARSAIGGRQQQVDAAIDALIAAVRAEYEPARRYVIDHMEEPDHPDDDDCYRRARAALEQKP